MRTNRGYLFRACKSQPPPLAFGRQGVKGSRDGRGGKVGIGKKLADIEQPLLIWAHCGVHGLAFQAGYCRGFRSEFYCHTRLASPLYVQSLRVKSMGSERGLHCWNGSDWAHTHFLQLPILPSGQVYLPLQMAEANGWRAQLQVIA